jgi:RNA polymerase sigma-70 factor (ECF subfamily)
MTESDSVHETQLIERAVDGDKAAFGQLYEHYLDRIYRYVYHNVSDHPEAEDLTEVVFLKAWEALPRFRMNGTGFQAWLYRIAHNLVIDRHRTRKPLLPLDQFFHLRDASPTPEATLERNETRSDLSRALEQLQPRLRQVILCRFIGELSHAETAKVLGIKEGYVRVLQYRALKQMQVCLDERRD